MNNQIYYKDKTLEFITHRDGSSKTSRLSRSLSSNSDTTNLLQPLQINRSPLDDFFELSRSIKNDINKLNNLFEQLIKAHQACLRPTFEDPQNQFIAVNELTTQISSELQIIYNKILLLNIKSPNFLDREKIIENLKLSLLDNYKTISLQFQMTQQTFSASYNRFSKPKFKNNSPSIDLTSFNLGDENSQRALELQQRHENDELEQIRRRAADIQQIFKNLATLISEQGTLIDRIDYNITEALDNAKSAHENVVQAEKYQKKSRMWICAIILIVLILFLIVIAYFK